MKKNILLSINKQITFIGLFFITHAVQSMEITPIITQEQNEYHEKCARVAKYFITRMPIIKLPQESHTLTLSEAFDTFQKLDAPVQKLIRKLAIENELTSLIPITVPKDIFTAVIQSYIPQYERRKKVTLDNAKADTLETMILVPHQKIFDQNVVDAFSIFAAYTNQETITIKSLYEAPTADQGSLGRGSDYYDDDNDKIKSYGWSLNDFMSTTVEQRAKLIEIAKCHTEGRYGNFDLRYKMTQEDINLLMPIRDLIDGNDLFRHLQIGVPYEQPTKLKRFKDALLLAAPLSIAEGVIPHMIYNNIDGTLQGILGGVASYGAGFVTGNSVFPLFDAWNTNALIIHKNFGPNNKTTVEKKWSFAALSLFHYVMHIIAQKLLSVPTLSYQAVGYTLHGLRALSSAANVIDMRAYFNYWRTWPGLFACHLNLKKYNHPLERRNEEDKSYTLIDSLNAQPKQPKQTTQTI